jgi:hypothetical protein
MVLSIYRTHVEQEITQAAKFAADHGHPEGELSSHRCLRLLDQ